MKKIFLLCALTFVLGGAALWHQLAKPRRFGAFAAAPKVEVAALIADPKAFTGKLVSVEGVINEQCKTMGCYFFFHSGDQELRVDVQEVAMRAPMREGRPARVEGQIVPYNDGYQFAASAVEFK